MEIYVAKRSVYFIRKAHQAKAGRRTRVNIILGYFSGGIVFKMIYSLANELIAIKFPSGSAT